MYYAKKCYATVLVLAVCAAVHAQMVPAIQEAVYAVIDQIYQLDAQQLQEIVCQQFDCIPEIDADQLRERMQHEPDLMVINVLPERWYEDCHIAGSVNVPLKQLLDHVADWDRSQKIVVYCALDACDAGQKAYILLRCMGFEQVVDYPGGIREWYQLSLPIDGPCAADYLHDDIVSHRAVCDAIERDE